jgi:hypothetical protein
MRSFHRVMPLRMRKVFSIICYVIAGFFFYMVCVMAFANAPSLGVKLGTLLGVSIPAVVAHLVGLALSRFRNWRRDTGIVLLSAAGVSAFLVFTFVCMLMTEEFRKMMNPKTLTFFSDYLTGGGLTLGLLVVGWLFVWSGKADTAGSGAV